eukprot:CAMPEP_0175609558 /NCGR_PEP_ID=MMETSP0096-20121207/62327_1 /TAXON_ID=311494 /ORGANISM="Alexandrium monilatum, Strain CCMP3105" /LENGTH=45 /DNA_ID= /DNA_START= /DNA_END= /DNA_ORIENTATION=
MRSTPRPAISLAMWIMLSSSGGAQPGGANGWKSKPPPGALVLANL